MADYDKLYEIIACYKSVLIAYSGGTDSTFLAAVAKKILGDRVLLVTATSSTYPKSELEQATAAALELGIQHKIIESEELDIPGFSANTPLRCYYCKSELFTKLTALAKESGCDAVLDGSNADDLCDYRPGLKAKAECGVISPLALAGFTKQDVRKYSADLGLTTAKKGTFACLASRFPYGEEITEKKLKRVGDAEAMLSDLGFVQFRIRSHGDLARIEVSADAVEKLWNQRETAAAICKKCGFIWTAIDCQGYRTGSMNEALDFETKKSSGNILRTAFIDDHTQEENK